VRYPVGPIFQALREMSLTAIPADVKAGINSPWSLQDWRESGNYSVVGHNSRSFILECAPVDLGSCFLTEAELLLDHIAEQRVTVWSALFSSGWVSPAWLVVTIYYWNFFAVLAISRLVGSSVHFLTGGELKKFKTLASSDCKLGGGAYHFSFDESISVTKARYFLTGMKNSNFHEAIWRHFASTMHSAFQTHGDDQANQLEYRLFRCVADNPTGKEAVWPTLLRNMVNYRPGVAYREVRNARLLDVAKYVRKTPLSDYNELVSAYENEKQMAQNFDFDNSCHDYSKLLLLKAAAVTAIAERLHLEIRKRRGIDGRWADKRLRFYDQHKVRLEVAARYAAL